MRWFVIYVFLSGATAQYLGNPSTAQIRGQQQRRQLPVSTVRPPPPPPPHQSTTQELTLQADLLYRITRLEVLLAEKLENLRSEVRETSRRLQALEWQSNEAHSTLEGLRSDLNRFVQQIPSPPVALPAQHDTAKLEQRVDDLSKGLQILVAATRTLTSHINVVKSNVSSIANNTNSLLTSASNYVTKQFFNNGLLELKHRQLYQFGACPTSPPPSSSTNTPKNCKEVAGLGHTHSGIYRIQPEHSAQALMVVCDLQTRGGGWTVIQNRYDGSQDFYLSWHDYKYGFGNLGGEFWLGLDNVHQLTGYDVNELLVELQDVEVQNKSAHYTAFSVGPEVEGYPLKILGGFSGDAGDSLTYHAGGRFSTKDMDQDSWPEGSCAQAHGGAWWYRNCDMSNLNGRYLAGELPEQYIYQGMYWGEFRGAQYSLLRVRMLVRPREQVTPLLLDEIFNTKMSPVSPGK